MRTFLSTAVTCVWAACGPGAREQAARPGNAPEGNILHPGVDSQSAILLCWPQEVIESPSPVFRLWLPSFVGTIKLSLSWPKPLQKKGGRERLENLREIQFSFTQRGGDQTI